MRFDRFFLWLFSASKKKGRSLALIESILDDLLAAFDDNLTGIDLGDLFFVSGFLFVIAKNEVARHYIA